MQNAKKNLFKKSVVLVEISSKTSLSQQKGNVSFSHMTLDVGFEQEETSKSE